MIRKNLARALSFCLVTGWIACHTSGVTALAAETDTSMTGELAFAQCEEYINIRQEPDENGEVVAKIYNDNAATIISKTGDWYQITSGNAFGYVKADYLVTGDEASAIAEKVQYHIARIHPEELYIRSEKSEESTAVGSVHQADEVDAVSYDNGAWIQIVADDGTKGYINAYYADYLTCYPVAETLEEEQDRLRNQADTSETGEGSGQGAIYGVEKAAEYTEPVSYDSESSSDTGSVADGSGNDGYTESSDSYDSGYSEENTDTSTADGSQDYSTDTSGDESWDNSSDASDDTTWSDTSDSGSADSTGSGDSYTESDNSTAETDGSYSEPDNSYIEPEAPETDASYSEPETSAPRRRALHGTRDQCSRDRRALHGTRDQCPGNRRTLQRSRKLQRPRPMHHTRSRELPLLRQKLRKPKLPQRKILPPPQILVSRSLPTRYSSWVIPMFTAAPA